MQDRQGLNLIFSDLTLNSTRKVGNPRFQGTQPKHLTPGENINDTTLPVSQLEQGFSLYVCHQ